MKKIPYPFILLALFLVIAQISRAQGRGAGLQAAAEAAYDRGYTAEKPADQAAAFDEAARLFDQAAREYRTEGQEEKARSAEHMAGLARQNAAHRRQMAGSVFFNPPDGLTGPFFKLYRPPTPRIYFLAEGGFSFRSQAGTEAFDGGGTGSLQQAIYHDPLVVDQLFEKTGGEFFIGSLSGPAVMERFSRESTFYKGISIGGWLSSRWQLEGTVGLSGSRITADFPVTVFRPENHEFQSLSGQVSTKVNHVGAALGINRVFLSGAVRLTAGVGINYAAGRPQVTEAVIEGIIFPAQKKEAFYSFGAGAMAAISWQPAGPLLLRLTGRAFTERGPDQGKNSLNGTLAFGLGLML